MKKKTKAIATPPAENAETSLVQQQARLGGLNREEVNTFIELHGKHTGTTSELLAQARKITGLSAKKMDALEGVLQLSSLTADHLSLTESLVKTQKITSPTDVKSLAGNTHKDWEQLLKESKVDLGDKAAGKTQSEKIKNYAKQLEAAFYKKYPSASFAARLKKNLKSKQPHKDKVVAFLEKNGDFDLLQHPIGSFLRKNPKAVTTKDSPEVAHQVRRIQRVIRLTPSYDSATVLLHDDIHSAQQIHQMGKDQFVRKYEEKLGETEAAEIFEKASTVHAASLALSNDLRSMSAASPINAFPNYNATLVQQLTDDLPSLETLFGHGDYYDIPECKSVYGAAAYFTDILHYLDQRSSTLDPIAGKKPSVKEILLRRRPDLGDIDLNCDNTNTEIPYIDIACEVMEDYIAAPTISIASTFFAAMIKGTIPTALLTALKAQFVATGQTNINDRLTASATISESFTTKHLQANNTYITKTNWIIRDAQLALKASNTSASNPLEVRVLHQTFSSSASVNTGSEYINTNAYALLKTTKNAVSLPFDLYETEGETYLEKLGIQKAELINTFRKEDKAAPGTSTTDLKMAYAGLGINEAEQALIFTADPTHQALYWGAETAAASSIVVKTFENLSGLTYAQVNELVQLQFVNPTKDTVIEHDDLSANTTTQRLTNITPAKLDAIHRLLRIWRKTTFTLTELDALIMSPAIGNGKITTKLALQLYQFRALQQQLKLDVFQLLAFYQNLDVTHNLPDCHYNRLFQNSAVTNPINANFSINAATPGTLSLPDADRAVVAAALQVSLADVNALVTKTISRISFPALSVMYRHAQLAQSLDISINALFAALNVIDADPFQSLQTTCQFLDKYQFLKTTGFTVDELNYILRHQDTNPPSLIPAATTVSAALIALREEISAVRSQARPIPEHAAAQLGKWLADSMLKWDTSLVNRLFDILNTVDDADYQQKLNENAAFLLNLRLTYANTVISVDLASIPTKDNQPIALPSQLSYDADKKLLQMVGFMGLADQVAILNLAKDDVVFQNAVTKLFTLAQQTDNSTGNVFFVSTAEINASLKNIPSSNINARFAYFVTKLVPVYKKLVQQNVLVKNISTWFNIDKKAAFQLLVSIPAIYTDLTADDFIDKTLPINNPAQVNRYQLLAKIGFIVSRLKLNDVDLAFFIARAGDLNCLNLAILPWAFPAITPATLSSFETFVNLVQLTRNYPATNNPGNVNEKLSIYTILTDAITKGTLTGTALSTYLTNLVSQLSALTGWNAADLAALINTPNLLGLVLPADLKSVPILIRLHKRFEVLSRLGITATDAFAWTKDSLSVADVAKIKQVLKLNYGNTDWLEVAEPLQNKLREKKRDALIGYLLANPGTQTWKDTKDLYGYFLLDTEMGACQKTSRIVQATNTVQLFVQRCFLQLEDGVLINTKTDSGWQQWQWMKSFRLWQANIKVFLYPENYIEPELLPTGVKSEFLAELENELLQGELNASNAETAFQNYLDKLVGIARLEIKNSYFDDASKTLHVIGRSLGGDPKVYYYRKFIAGRRWTPWVKIDLDINSEFVVPVVYNNHVYLFWGIVKTQQENSANWQIQLAYSKFKNGKWTPKKVSENNDFGRLFCSKSTYPNISRFFFVAMDIPSIDYKSLYNASGQIIAAPATFQKIKASVLQNGSLVIGAYYFEQNIGDESGGLNSHQKPIGNFQLDIANGYPVKINLLTTLFIQSISDGYTFRNMVNMFDMEVSEPVVPPIPGINIALPDNSRGRYRIVSPLQMGIPARIGLFANLQGLHPGSTPTPLATYSDAFLPSFYQDQHRTYLLKPFLSNDAEYNWDYDNQVTAALNALENGSLFNIPSTPPGTNIRYRFINFFHPLIGYFMQRLFINGVDGLMARDTQLKGDANYDTSTDNFNFANYYTAAKTGIVILKGANNTAYPTEEVDFSMQSGYGLYNWELFYHAPLMIAERLSQNQQYDEADRWYRYIFNPLDTSPYIAPNKFWNTKPFFKTTSDDYIHQRIDDILNGVNTGTNQELLKAVADWRNNPFQPHFVAETRTVAYQKVAVMKYVGHLIRYGDYLFGQHTIESINQATQLYLLASEILGPKPELIPPVAKVPVDNYYQLEQKLDAAADALVNVENLLPLHVIKGYPNSPAGQAPPNLKTLYFGIPQNEQMTGATGYWDTVADRLFKIRHCLDIEGTLAPISLFSNPIDPAILVRATAAGLDIGSILNEINSPLPIYRFNVVVQKATEISNEVKSLGALLLSVLEKRDAEALSLLRSGHEMKLLSALAVIKDKQIADAQMTLDSLGQQFELITMRETYYDGLVKDGLSSAEKAAMALSEFSLSLDISIALSYLTASMAAVYPQSYVGGLAGPSGGGIGLTSEGGSQLADSANSLARNFGSIAAASDKGSALINTNSNYTRRKTEWQFQADLASKELKQVQKQIEGAKIRLEIAKKDAENHQIQLDNIQEADEFMRSKFTNEELYSWMVSQVSNTYFKSYQLAYEIARKAEQCLRYELGLSSSAYIKFGYWDSLKKGLLAGEQLTYDIKFMESAYLDQNKRELELNKPISIAQLDPVALHKLKTTGECWFNLPEEIFDMDYPGHYMRRIKSVSVTIPCITGPYTTVSCKLTMTNNSVRVSSIAPTEAPQYSRKTANNLPSDDPRFKDAVGAIQSIATSGAQNDSGLFELNFRDERYLPFEGAGAISLWHLELPAAIRQFDLNSISDVIIHLKYTARDGGEQLKTCAKTSLNTKINQMLVSTKDKGLMRAFSAKNDLSSAWYRFLNPVNDTDDQVLTLDLNKEAFPLFVQGKTIKIKSMELVADTTKTVINGLQVTPAPVSPVPGPVNLSATGIYGSWLSVALTYNENPGNWTLKNPVTNQRLTTLELKNLVVIVHYEVS